MIATVTPPNMSRTPGGCACTRCHAIVVALIARQLQSVAPEVRTTVVAEAMALASKRGVNPCTEKERRARSA